MSERSGALWVSTSLETRGGISASVRTLRDTPLWSRWRVHHVATHEDGTALTKVVRFVRGLVAVGYRLAVHRPALVHIHMSSAGSFVRKATVFWLARAARVPTVVHVHSGRFHDFHRNAPRPLRALIRRTLETADAVVVLSGLWRDRLSAVAPRARFVVVPNAVDVPPEPVARREGPAHVVFLGRIWDKKGAFTLLEAWAAALTALDAAGAGHPGGDSSTGSDRPHLTLAGDGEGERARRTAAALGLSDTVTVLDWVPAARARALLADADVLALPSLNEGQPMVILEAMAAGAATLATTVGGIPGMVQDGREGLLVEPEDREALTGALRDLLGDPDRRYALGDAAHRRARREYDADAVWRRFDDLYTSLAKVPS